MHTWHYPQHVCASVFSKNDDRDVIWVLLKKDMMLYIIYKGCG